MPTMAEYAKSGGYARDAAISKNFANTRVPSYSGGSSSSKKKTSTPSSGGYMGVPMAGGSVPRPPSYSSGGATYTPGPSNWNGMSQAERDAYTSSLVGPGAFNRSGSSVPPPMNMRKISAYVDNQINTKLTAAENAANATRTTAQTDAQQSTALLDNQLSQAVARLQAAREQAATGVTTGYNRAQAQTRDNRVLQDQSFQRQANPFSGATSYQQGMIGREREISDRQQTEDLNSRLGAINQDALNQQGSVEQDVGARKAAIQQNLTNLLSKIETDRQALKDATGAERERLIRDITKDERNYQLQLQEQNRADVLAQAQQYQQDWQRQYQEGRSAREDLVADRNYDYQVGKDVQQDFRFEQEQAYRREQDQRTQDEQRRQSNIALAQWGVQQFGYGQPKSDAGVFFEQYAGVPTQAAQKLAQDAAQMGFENAIKKALAENTISQSQANIALEQAQLQIQQQNANTASSNASRSASNAEADNRLARERFEYEKSQQPQSKTTDYKMNPDFAQDMQYVVTNKEAATTKLQQNAQAFIQKYGYDGYQALVNAVK